MTAAGLQPTRVTFNTLLKACMRGKDAARADEVLVRMQERDCQVQSTILLQERLCMCSLLRATYSNNTMTITMKNAASLYSHACRRHGKPPPKGPWTTCHLSAAMHFWPK